MRGETVTFPAVVFHPNVEPIRGLKATIVTSVTRMTVVHLSSQSEHRDKVNRSQQSDDIISTLQKIYSSSNTLVLCCPPRALMSLGRRVMVAMLSNGFLTT